MRRPLFMVCLCLVMIMAMRMVAGERERTSESPSWSQKETYEKAVGNSEEADENTGEMSVWTLEEVLDGQQLVITGRVYQKDTKAFYIEDIIINLTHLQRSAAVQQQTLSNTINISDKLICEYDALVHAENATGAFWDGQEWGNDETGNMLVLNRGAFEETAFSTMEVRLGSWVTLQGELRLFTPATNPGEFDGKEYYGSLGIAGKLRNASLLEQGEEYDKWQEGLFRVKEYFRQRLYRIFPKKEAGVMAAMLLGNKSGLDGELKELYQENGIIHILSISGLHITIIGMSLYKLLRRLGMPVFPAALLGGGVLLLYGVMTGMSVSACRAIGMYLIHMLAEVVGRTYDMLTALGLVAAIMVCQNPAYLQNAGFYLSFGAVLGIGVMFPALTGEPKEQKVKPYEEREWKRRLERVLGMLVEGLEQSILASISITMTTLPVQLWFYYEISVYSVFINLLVLPFMSWVMLAGLFAMLVPGLGIVGTIDCMILTGYEKLCLWFEQLPFHTWNPGRPQLWQMVVYYGMWLGVIILGNMRKKYEGGDKNRKRILAVDRKKEEMLGQLETNWKMSGKKSGKLAGWLSVKCWLEGKKRMYGIVQIIACVGAVLMLGMRYPAQTVLTFLDVGQGDCICLQTASGAVYLFDCGSSNRSKIGEYVLKPFLKYYGIQKIDAIFVSHPDADHCSGVKELLENGKEWRVRVEQLVLPNIGDKETDEKLLELQNVAHGTSREEVELCYVEAGDAWQTEELEFTCLHPPAEWSSEDSNAYSECFYVKFTESGLELLLTGDVQEEGEALLLEELRERGIEQIDLLKVAHHGSRNSSSAELLEQLSPTLAVISCAEYNSYGHPHKETLERLEDVGSRVMVTKDWGAIRVEIGEEIRVYGYEQ